MSVRRRLALYGTGVAAAAMFLFTQIGTATSYLSILPILCVMAAGIGMAQRKPITVRTMGGTQMMCSSSLRGWL